MSCPLQCKACRGDMPPPEPAEETCPHLLTEPRASPQAQRICGEHRQLQVPPPFYGHHFCRTARTPPVPCEQFSGTPRGDGTIGKHALSPPPCPSPGASFVLLLFSALLLFRLFPATLPPLPAHLPLPADLLRLGPACHSCFLALLPFCLFPVTCLPCLCICPAVSQRGP
jgi:hypothetical protein